MSPQEPQARDEIIRLWGISEFRPEALPEDNNAAVSTLRYATRHFALHLQQYHPGLAEEIGSNIFDHLDEWILGAEGVRKPPPPVR